ncbi:MAG: hypothetical protein PHN98_08535 [Smithellaceae bacterium]|nr:hypothetical protein [Smithellaceae bacterium]
MLKPNNIAVAVAMVFVLAVTIGCGKSKTKKQSSVSVTSTSDWVEYGTTHDGGVLLYDKAHIKNQPGNIFQVWTKYIFSDESRGKFMKGLIKTGPLTENWEGLSQMTYLNEIDCKKRMSRYLSKTFYDKNYKIIVHVPFNKPDWKQINPESHINNLRKIICSP